MVARLFAALLLAPLILACSSSPKTSAPSAAAASATSAASTPAPAAAPRATPAPKGFVSAADFGDKWPLTVESGTITCARQVSGGRNLDGVYFETGGKKYAVNGTAKGRSPGTEIDPIWAANEKTAGLKKDIGPILDAGLKLCA